MLKKLAFLAFLLFPTSLSAAELTPILVSDGVAKMPCDATWRAVHGTPLFGKQVVQTYLFGNLVTDPNAGADVILWSDAYGDYHPQSQYGSLGELHKFDYRLGGGRQGEYTLNFGQDGVTVPGDIYVLAICWGGGTLEIYAQIWVRDPPAP